MRADYPELAVSGERELKISEILMTALKILGKRFWSFLLLVPMFYLPAQAVLGYVSYTMPDLSAIEDPLAFAEAYAEAVFPTVCWSAELEFFTLIGALTAVTLTYGEIYTDEEKPSFGAALYRAIRRWPAAAVTLLVLGFGLLTCVLASSALVAVLPGLILLVLPFLLFYLLFFGLMKNASAVVAVHTGFAAWKNTACVNMLFRERFSRVMGVFLALAAVAELPRYLISLLASLLLEMLESTMLAQIISVVLSALLALFSVFLVICTVLLVNNYGDMQTRKLRGEEEDG